MKRCSRCGEEKGLEEFGKDASKPDNKSIYCRPCSREMNRRAYRKAINASKARAVLLSRSRAAHPKPVCCPTCGRGYLTTERH